MVNMTLLGQARIAVDGESITRFRSQKEVALLIYLAHTGLTGQRESLADLLWEASTTKQSLANLRTALTRVRGQVGDILLTTRRTIAYQGELRDQVDSVRFQREVAALTRCATPQEAQRLHDALALFTGDFLRGFYVTDAPRFNEWAVVEQELLRRQAVSGCRVLIDYALSADAPILGMDAVRCWLDIDSLNEEAHIKRMQLLAADGQVAAALNGYAQLVDMLETELGMEPQADTAAVYRRILRGEGLTVDRLPPPVTAHGLPRQGVLLVGREAEISALDAHLHTKTDALITLVGPGGVGKTALVVELLTRLLKPHAPRPQDRSNHTTFGDGIYYLALESVTHPTQLTNAIATSVGCTFKPNHGDEQNQLIQYLREKSLLLALDGFEHLAAESTVVEAIVAGAPMVQMLVTSRRPLDLAGEHVMRLDGLDTTSPDAPSLGAPSPDAPGDDAAMLQSSAVQLFLQSARRTDMMFELHVDDLPHLARICTLVQGLPLSIVLAANWVSTLTPSEIADEIQRDVTLLASENPAMPARHRSVQATFNHSWHLLMPTERRILTTLAVLRSGYTMDMAEAVAGATLPELRALIKQSLLQRDLKSGRLYMHELIRQLALTKLSVEGLTAATVHAHALAAFETLYANTLPTVYDELAYHAQAAGAVDKARRYLYRAGKTTLDAHQYARAAASFSQALTLTPDDLPEDRYRLHLAREEAHHWPAQRAPQAADLQALEELARALDDPQKQITVKLRTARFAEATSDHTASLAAAQDAAHTADAIGDEELVARSRLAWGVALGRQGDYAAAGAQLDLAMAAARTAKITEVESACLRNLGIDAAYRGDFPSARRYFEQDLALIRRLGDRESERQTLGNLGVIARYLGDLDGARVYLEDALKGFRQIGDRRGELIAHSNLGVVAHHDDNFPAAAIRYRKALAISRQIADRQSESEALIHLGGLFLDQGQSRTARPLYEEARAVALRANLPAYAIEAQSGLAAALLDEGELTVALALVREHLDDIVGDGLAAAEDPMRVYFYCYQVLRTNDDVQADAMLAKAFSLLEEQAKHIVDPDLQHAFRTNIPINRKILAAA